MTWTKEAARKGGLESQRKRREDNRFSLAVQARWAAEQGSEEEVIEYFRKVAIEEGLAVLARMRENCKHASLTLNTRITADNNKDRCEFCGGPKKNNRQWALVRPYRDPVTLLLGNKCFCSIECVALMNRRDQGVYGVSDRGMLPEMNPTLHPKQVEEESVGPNGEAKKEE